MLAGYLIGKLAVCSFVDSFLSGLGPGVATPRKENTNEEVCVSLFIHWHFVKPSAASISTILSNPVKHMQTL